MQQPLQSDLTIVKQLLHHGLTTERPHCVQKQQDQQRQNQQKQKKKEERTEKREKEREAAARKVLEDATAQS